MRPEARFHDGSRLTAHDVAFSLTTLKANGHPIITQFLRDLAGAEALDDATVVVRFAAKPCARRSAVRGGHCRSSRSAYYSKRPFDQTTLETPLGSGPYKVGRFEAGRYIEYRRVPDWWGANLPVARGRYNFDTVRYEYYRDREVGFEGFTAKSYLFREEFTSRIWATRYDFPAIKDGRVKREVLPDETPSGAQGWFLNMRRAKFKSPKLREALVCAFDFEWTNKTVMYGSYDRTHSVFQNSDMMANGKPGPDELALLEPFRGKVPDEVFGEPFVPPVSDGSGQDRALLRRASQLLQEAGYVIKDGQRIGPDGERISIEFLLGRAVVPAASHALHQESFDARDRRQDPHGRSGADPAAPQRVRFRHHDPAFRLFLHAGRFAAQLLLVPGGRAEGFAKPRRHRRSGDRRHDRARDRRPVAGRIDNRLPCFGPADPRRALLDSALVQGVALDRVLGYVRPAGDQTAICAGHPGNVVARPDQGGQNRATRLARIGSME